MSTTTPAKSPKIDTPEIFTGDRNKSTQFLRQNFLYMFAKEEEFSDDKKKVAFALSYMKGGVAGSWSSEYINQIVTATPSQLATFTWTKFQTDFLASFKELDQAGNARAKMTALFQGRWTADEYVTKFQELTPLTKYDDVAHIEFFRKGLSQRILDQLSSMSEMPDTLNKWYNMATRFDLQNREREAEKARLNQKLSGNPFTPRSDAYTQRSGTPFTPRSGGYNPRFSNYPTRTIGAFPMGTNNNTPRFTKLTDAERAELMKTGSCFACRKSGHRARDCPNRSNRTPIQVRALQDTNMDQSDQRSDQQTENPIDHQTNPITSLGQIMTQLTPDQREEATAFLRDSLNF